jgi:hypothetical protein
LNSICIQFDRGEYWFSQSQCDDALRLLGLQPDDEKDPNMYNVRMMNYGATPGANDAGWAGWLDRQRIPDAVRRHFDGQMLLQEECRDTLRHIVMTEREELAALQRELRTAIEAPNHDESEDWATILKGKDGALYDRYYRTQTSACHRATKAIRELHEEPLEPAPPDDRDPQGSGRGDAAVAEPSQGEPGSAAAAPEPMRADSSFIHPTPAGPQVPSRQGEPQRDAREERPQPVPELGVQGSEAVAPEDMETAVAVGSVDLAPPPPRPTFLVEAARCLAAQGAAAGPVPAAASEAAADRARLPAAVPQLTTQVIISQDDRTSQSAEAKAPKEIRFDRAGSAPGDGQRPVAGCEARARGPTGG